MKILHLGEKIYGGGAENVFYQTIVSLQQFGQSDIQHFFAFKSHPKVNLSPHLDFNNGKLTSTSKIASIYSIYNFRLLDEYLKELQPDIIHVQLIGNLSPSVLRALFNYKKLRKNIKIVQTVHSFEHVCSHQAAYDYRHERRCTDCRLDHYKMRIFYRLCSRGGRLHSIAKGITSIIGDYYFNRGLIDCYICPSIFLASLLKKRYQDEVVVRLVKNPIPFIAVKGSPKTDTITYFGRLSEEKNLRLLIKAMPKVLEVKSVRLRIIGEGPDKTGLLALAEEESVTAAIDFIPFVPQNELFQLISDAKVFVLSSKLYETFSLVLYESIMAGLLPVVPAHGPLKEGVAWLNCGLLYESDNYHDLAEKVIFALTQYNSHIPLMNIAREKIINELNLRKYIDSIERIYNTI